MLDQRHRLGAGSYTMLEGYPLYLWLEPDAQGVDLSVTGRHRLQLKHWRWPDGQRAEPGPSLELLGGAPSTSTSPLGLSTTAGCCKCRSSARRKHRAW